MNKQAGVIHLLIPIVVGLVILVAVAAFLLGGNLKDMKGVDIAPEFSTKNGIDQNFNNPLASHDTFITFSTDPKAWEPGTLVKTGASVPELIQLNKDVGKFEKGDLLIYFVDATTLTGHGTEGINTYYSSDLGKTWSEAGLINVSNKPNKGAV